MFHVKCFLILQTHRHLRNIINSNSNITILNFATTVPNRRWAPWGVGAMSPTSQSSTPPPRYHENLTRKNKRSLFLNVFTFSVFCWHSWKCCTHSCKLRCGYFRSKSCKMLSELQAQHSLKLPHSAKVFLEKDYTFSRYRSEREGGNNLLNALI